MDEYLVAKFTPNLFGRESKFAFKLSVQKKNNQKQKNKMEKIGIDEMSVIRREAGQSDKKVANSAQEFISTPEEGEFDYVGTKEFDIPNVGLRTSVGLHLVGGGFISENAINAQNIQLELVEIRTGENKGKFMLKSERLSNLANLGFSADARLIALQGKKFKTEPVSGLTLQKFDKEIMFVVGKSKDFLAKLTKNTEPKKYHRFTIID